MSNDDGKANDTDNDDLLTVVEDDPPQSGAAESLVWRVLVVDDDDDIHEATRFALKGRKILDRAVSLIHARSAAEAWERMGAESDVAVALIDVVMETPFAGLDLVRKLREAGYSDLRIVLRTGQPGYAPELSVISSYEIDDYRTKSELTQTRLLTVLTATIRAYSQIRTISRSRTGLEMIVNASPGLFQRTNLELFASGVLTQIAALLRIDSSGIMCIDGTSEAAAGHGRIISASGRFAPFVGGTIDALDDERVVRLVRLAGKRGTPIQEDGFLALTFQSKTGQTLIALVETAHEIPEQDLVLLRLFGTNIAVCFENVTLVERLDRLAHMDSMLQVPNHNAFEAALRSWIAQRKTDGRIALINIDALPFVVACYGMKIANWYLGAIYTALTADRPEVFAGALIGEKTFALLGNRHDLDRPMVERAFEEPYSVGGIDVASTVTSVLMDLHSMQPEPTSVMRLARAALLHVARTSPGETIYYDEAVRTSVERRIEMQIALKQSIENGKGFSVHLQPKVELRTGNVIGAEALLRWTHEGKAVSPVEFIPIAEAGGMIERLTGFVLDTVAFWQAGRRAAPVPVAVNLSMVDLNKPGFAGRFLALVASTGLSPETVSFEVTESVAIQDAAWAVDQLQAIKAAGFGIALDDFGTGYSSLGQFDRLPIDTLKIDRQFVDRLARETASGSLAAVILGMARTLNVECVAEGIETGEQAESLIALGCEYGQGYHFGRPVPIEQFDGRYLE